MTSLEEIRPFEDLPPHFGGGIVASPTASLKSIRLKSLPSLPKLRGVASSEAKRIYKKLASGSFCVEAKEGQVQGHTSLLIDIYLLPSKTNDDTPSDPSDAALPDPSGMKVKAIKRELESFGVDCTPFVEKGEMISALIDARKNPPARSSSNASRGDHVMKIACISGVMGGKEFSSFGLQSHYNPEFNTIPKETLSLLSDRLIHYYLRHCGSKILPRVWVPKVARTIIERYGASQLPLAMDIAACVVDIYCSEGVKEGGGETDTGYISGDALTYWGDALTEAGEAFEAGGHWFAAKDTYVMNAEGPFSLKGKFPQNNFQQLTYAGLAIKRAGDSARGNSERMGLFHQAEELYVRAWANFVTWGGGLGDLNSNPGYCAHLTNVMICYDQINEETPIDPSSTTGIIPADSHGGHEASEDEAMLFLLSALLYLAGFRNFRGRTRELILMQGPQYVSLLQDHFQTSDSARKLLESALSVPNKRHFRDIIMGAKGTAIILYGKETAIRADRRPGKTIQEKVLESFDQTSSRGTNVDVFGCDGPGCSKMGDEKLMKSCPCKGAYYCGVGCQSKDWPKHKKCCSYHKKKMAEKKKAKKENA